MNMAGGMKSKSRKHTQDLVDEHGTDEVSKAHAAKALKKAVKGQKKFSLVDELKLERVVKQMLGVSASTYDIKELMENPYSDVLPIFASIVSVRLNSEKQVEKQRELHARITREKEALVLDKNISSLKRDQWGSIAVQRQRLEDLEQSKDLTQENSILTRDIELKTQLLEKKHYPRYVALTEELSKAVAADEKVQRDAFNAAVEKNKANGLGAEYRLTEKRQRELHRQYDETVEAHETLIRYMERGYDAAAEVIPGQEAYEAARQERIAITQEHVLPVMADETSGRKAQRINMLASLKFISEFSGVRDSELVESADTLRDSIADKVLDAKRKLELTKMDPEDDSSETMLEYLLRTEKEIHEKHATIIRAERKARQQAQEGARLIQVTQKRCERNIEELTLLNDPHFFAGAYGNPALLLEKLEALYAVSGNDTTKSPSVAFELRLKDKISKTSPQELAEFESTLQRIQPKTGEQFNILGIAQDIIEAFRLRQEVERQRQIAEQQRQTKDDIAGIVRDATKAFGQRQEATQKKPVTQTQHSPFNTSVPNLAKGPVKTASRKHEEEEELHRAEVPRVRLGK
jgi:hypothetical protein